jgi:hypothetical protein
MRNLCKWSCCLRWSLSILSSWVFLVCFHLFNCRIPCLSDYFWRVSFHHSFIRIGHSSIFNMAINIWLHNKLVDLLDTVTA